MNANQEKLITDITPVIRKMTPKAKQAMYAAASKSLLRRGTWDGCAFNAAGKAVTSQHITSTDKAGKAFGMHSNIVSEFIGVWDHSSNYLNDAEATEALKEAILKVGLFTGAGNTIRVRISRVTVNKNQQEAERDAFEAIVKDIHIEKIDEDSESLGADAMALAGLFNGDKA